MYCSNCGKEVDKNAVVCIHCGCALNNNMQTKKKGHGKGIASMVLGIIAIVFALAAFGNVSDDSLRIALRFTSSSYQFGYAIGTVLIQAVLAIVGVCLAIADRKTEKNGYNTAGLWLAIITFIMIVIQFIMVVTY